MQLKLSVKRESEWYHGASLLLSMSNLSEIEAQNIREAMDRLGAEYVDEEGDSEYFHWFDGWLLTLYGSSASAEFNIPFEHQDLTEEELWVYALPVEPIVNAARGNSFHCN